MKPGTMINGAFGAMEAVDGAKKVKKNYTSQNKYDSLMGTSLNSKTPSNMGVMNASVANPKYASEEIDIIYKQAAFNRNSVRSAFNSAKSMASRGANAVGDLIGAGVDQIDRLDNYNNANINNFKDAVKNRQLGEALTSGGKAALVTVPAVGGMVGAGVGTAKGLKKLDKDRDSDASKDIEYNTIGSAVTGALALNAALKGKAVGTGVDLIREAGNAIQKYPKKLLKKNPAGKVVVGVNDAVSKGVNRVNKAAEQAAEQAARKTRNSDINAVNRFNQILNRRNAPDMADVDAMRSAFVDSAKNDFIRTKSSELMVDGMGRSEALSQAESLFDSSSAEELFERANSIVNRKASSEIDDMVKIASMSDVKRYGNYLKRVGKENFFKEGLGSVVYFGVPATLGLALNRDFRKGIKKIDKPEDQEKTADTILDNPKIKPVLKQVAEKGSLGLGRTIFPATFTALTGKNIMNSFQDIDDEGSGSRQEDMARKIIINIDGDISKRKLKKQVSQEIDSALKKQATEGADVGDILLALQEDIDKRIKGSNGRLKSRPVHIGEGVKKQFRMNN